VKLFCAYDNSVIFECYLELIQMMTKTFLIEGMTCRNCKSFIELSLKTISGVDDVIADLANCQVRVSGEEVDSLSVKQLVEDSGYYFKGEIHHHSAKGSDVWYS